MFFWEGGGGGKKGELIILISLDFPLPTCPGSFFGKPTHYNFNWAVGPRLFLVNLVVGESDYDKFGGGGDGVRTERWG